MRYRYGMMVWLTAASLMAGCSSEEPTDGGPKKGSHTVELALSVGTTASISTGSLTRQTLDVVQGQTEPVFRGIQDIVIIPFNIGTAVSIVGSDTPLSEKLELSTSGIPELENENSIKALNTVSNSQLFQDLAVPDNTNAFLFYGKAKGEDNAANGQMVVTGIESGSLSAVKFAPKPILETSTAPSAAASMAEYVSGICNTEGWAGEDENTTLGTLYKKMTSLTAGSSPNMLAALQNLYNKLLTLDDGNLKAAIISNMKIGSDAGDVLTEGNNHELSWNPDYSGTKFNDYPATFGLPDGAATLKWDNTTDPANPEYKPVLDGSIDNIGIADRSLTGVPLNRYAYPVPLYYYANSKVKVSENTMAEHYHDDQSDWTEVLGYYSEGAGSVTGDVYSVALIDPVQYAVGRLDIILWGEITGNENAVTFTDVAGDIVNMNDLKLTGILVSGQKAVDFSYTPVGSDVYTIYDNSMNETINLTTNKDKDGSVDKPYVVNHTMVLPTTIGEDVYLFFEFQNASTKDITVKSGSDETGLVPPGCKLYLCGKINAKEDVSNPKAVFESDHVAVITGKVVSLENAYNVVPPRELGLSVHLQVGVKNWDNQGNSDHPVYNW